MIWLTQLQPGQLNLCLWLMENFSVVMECQLSYVVFMFEAFNTRTGMPYGTVNLKRGVDPNETPITCTAGVGTFIVEFATISRLTGDQVFEKVALRALKALHSRRSKIGLVSVNPFSSFLFTVSRKKMTTLILHSNFKRVLTSFGCLKKKNDQLNEKSVPKTPHRHRISIKHIKVIQTFRISANS